MCTLLQYEFVSGDPKTYGLKFFSGRKGVVKAKGFSLHYANQQILNFESLKEQVLIKALTEDVLSLTEAQYNKTKQKKDSSHQWDYYEV